MELCCIILVCLPRCKNYGTVETVDLSCMLSTSACIQVSRSDVFLEATLELTVTDDLLADYVSDLGNIEDKWRKHERSKSV